MAALYLSNQGVLIVKVPVIVSGIVLVLFEALEVVLGLVPIASAATEEACGTVVFHIMPLDVKRDGSVNPHSLCPGALIRLLASFAKSVKLAPGKIALPLYLSQYLLMLGRQLLVFAQMMLFADELEYGKELSPLLCCERYAR